MSSFNPLNTKSAKFVLYEAGVSLHEILNRKKKEFDLAVVWFCGFVWLSSKLPHDKAGGSLNVTS